MTVIARRALIIAGTVVTALVVNLVVRLVGSAAGAEFTYPSAGETASSTPLLVVLETAIPLAIGLTLATLLASRWRRILPIAQVVGALLALATGAGALLSDFDSAASTVSLLLMHLVVATAVVLGLRMVGETLRPEPAAAG